jgi:peptidylglycine monooxygenase
MASLGAVALLLLIAQLVTKDVSSAPQPAAREEIGLHMPKVQPQEPDTYLCKSMEVKEARRYLTGFIPKADSHIAHHMLLYGCLVPGAAPGEVWNCGEMSKSSASYKEGPVCQKDNNILYAWAMEAPRLTLPDDVSFEIGRDTHIKYLVVQVHYKDVTKFLPPQNGDDSSGITLVTTPVPTPKLAGVYLMLTDGRIPAHSIEYFETACDFEEEIEIVPFAYRTHAHALGRVISGYRIRDGVWTEIGRKDPRLPEMFYNTTSPGITIKRGDILASRCTMENTLDHEVAVGMTQNDEMCNFYIMYYVNNPPILKDHMCGSMGPPTWYWQDFTDQKRLNLQAAPATVSVIPGKDKPLVRNATYDNDGADSYEEILNKIHEGFEDQSDNELLNQRISEMSPDELFYLANQIAAEENEEEAPISILQEQEGRPLELSIDPDYRPRSLYEPEYKYGP